MKRVLRLDREALTALDAGELAAVAGADYTGAVDCVLSFGRPCVTNMFCTGPFDCWIDQTA